MGDTSRVQGGGKLIPLKEAVDLWNSHFIGDEDVGGKLVSVCRNRKEHSFGISTSGNGSKDKFFDVGFVIKNKRYYIDGDKLLSSIDEVKQIIQTDEYKEGRRKREEFNRRFEEM
jgi:hypothetical protein